jgi:hypothetical protein
VKDEFKGFGKKAKPGETKLCSGGSTLKPTKRKWITSNFRLLANKEKNLLGEITINLYLVLEIPE